MNVLRLIDKVFPPKIAYAHCDIPCGIYDPHEAQMAAQTVLRMTQLIEELSEDDEKKRVSQIARFTKVKEEHAEIVKHQVRIIWGDYFKDEMLTKHKDLHSLVFKIMKLASKARQGVDVGACNELIAGVQKFAEIFWETKGRETAKVKSGYPTNGDMVLPK